MLDYKKFLEEIIIEGAKLNFQKDGEIGMYGFIGSPNGRIGVVSLARFAAIDKDLAATVFRAACKKEDAEFAATVCECWALDQPTEVEVEQVQKDGVESNPRSTEMIVVTYETKEVCGMISIPIFRVDKQGYLGIPIYYEELPRGSVVGRMANFLP